MNDLPAMDGFLSRVATRRSMFAVSCIGLVWVIAVFWLQLDGRTISQTAALAVLAALASVGGFALLSSVLELGSRPEAKPASNDYLASFVANLEDGVLLVLPDGQIAFSNQAFWAPDE